MNLNAVYELKERLETAVIAGVNLIQEDFRLKRAVEQIAPLAAVSPVFNKIYVSSGKLVSEECEDREGLLLDTLSLVDAVCVTQGSLQTEGEIGWAEMDGQERNEAEGRGETGSKTEESVSEEGVLCEPTIGKKWKNGGYKNFPYSVMAPVVEAFRGTGGGRYAVVRDACDAVPELFQDYRIESLMVQALGDSYGDMADMVQRWLEKKEMDIIPLVKRGFKPDGKRDMARRIQVIDAVAAGGENEFYRKLLADGSSGKADISKEVKEAAIRALRHEKDNEQLLLELLKTETGKMKEQALYALSFMDGEDSQAYWGQAMKKKPAQTASYLANTTKDWASDMIADALEQWVEEYAKEAQERRQNLLAIWSAAVGKHSHKLCQCYEAVYRLIPEEVPEVLVKSLIMEPHPALCNVTRAMYQEHREPFAEAYGVMIFLTETKERAYEELSVYLNPGLKEKLTKKNRDTEGIFRAVERLEYNEDRGCYQVNTVSSGPVYREYGTKRRLEAGLDFRWYGLLMNSPLKYENKWKYNYSVYRNRYDGVVARLYRPDMESLKKEYGAYFYDKALKQEVTVEGLRLMKRCGWTDYKGLLAAEGARNSSVAVYQIRQLIQEMPMSNTELADELDGYIKKSRAKAVNGIGLLEKWRDELRDGQTVERL